MTVQMKMSMAQGCSYEVPLANNNIQPLLTIQTLCIVTSPVYVSGMIRENANDPLLFGNVRAHKSAKLGLLFGYFRSSE